MNKYTVILLLPDYVAGQYGETYCAHVEARNHVGAVHRAQRLRAEVIGGGYAKAADFLPVFVAAGHHDDLRVL